MATDLTTLKRHGVTASTSKGMIIDAGAIYFNLSLSDIATAKPAFATQGGNEFSTGRTLRDIEVDGAYGPVKGFVRKDAVAPTITAKPINLTVETLTKAIAGAKVTTNTTHTVITGGEISLEDYIENVAIVGTVSGTNEPVIAIVKNALIKDAIQLAMAPKSEAIPSLVFVGHFDPENLEEEPWELHWPNDTETP